MPNGSDILLVAIGYVGALFMIAWAGDILVSKSKSTRGRPLTYAFSLAVYCTTWTVLGSVGTASTTGWGFVPVYLGPILVFVFAWPLIVRIVRIAKAQNITSIADFLAARYGKSPSVAAVVTVIAVVGTVPYMALQMKAILLTVETLQAGVPLAGAAQASAASGLETGLAIALGLALFAVLFGTRHIDATEHQFGLMLAISMESIVKLAAFVAVGVYVMVFAFGGIDRFWDALQAHPEVRAVFQQQPVGGNLLTITFLSACCILLLPRQFHVTVVENQNELEIRRAAWLFPSYLVLINLFVVPIAAAGLLLFPSGADPDLFFILVPMAGGAETVTMLAFIGVLSAATAMVVVEAVAVSILICNGLIVPTLLRNRMLDETGDLGRTLLNIRRVAIVCVVLAGYAFEQALASVAGLSAIGLVAFAAIAQLAPAFFLGLFWRGGSARGAIAGMVAGGLMWAYTLLLPWIIKAGFLPAHILDQGPFGLALLRPQALFYIAFDPLTHGVVWSILVNVISYIVVSRRDQPQPIERMQSQLFAPGTVLEAVPQKGFKVWRSSVTVADLKQTAARYLGAERTDRAFAQYESTRSVGLADHAEADVPTLRFTEHLLASAIGAASSRLVLSLLLRRGNFDNQSTLKLLDDASEALQHNRDLLQSAIDQVRHGLVVFDKQMNLICWNRRFREILDLPLEFGRVGVPLTKILRFMADRGDFGPGEIDDLINDRLTRLAVTRETFQERLALNRRYVEVRTAAMPQGGIVTTFADITQRVTVANALAEMNVTLERRVEERTAELLSSNAALAVAKAQADSANQDKTRFVTAATHDILQPLNAARLYSASLAERPLDQESARIAGNIDISLRAVEDIFGAIMELSRMDAGQTEPEVVGFPVAELFDTLKIDYAPLAAERGLDLRIVTSALWVSSDRRMLRRLMQNLLSNAIKYTRSGKVVVGARRQGNFVVLTVGDTGPGIAEQHRKIIFREFRRLDDRASGARGLGLGLSIVERIGRLLGAQVKLRSKVGKGSAFSVTLARAQPETVTKPASAKVAANDMAGALVVCIDNEPAIVEGMATLLTSWGCQCVIGSDTKEVMHELDALGRDPVAVVADYHLDNGTGDVAIARLQQRFGASLSGIIITADHSTETERSIRDQGLHLLRKPVKAAALRALLTRVLQQTHVPAE